MEDELRANMLLLADAYVAGTGAAQSTVAMKAVRDARFFDRLRDDKGFTVKTYDTVLAWFSENWPASVAWPDTVSRPALSPILSAETAA